MRLTRMRLSWWRLRDGRACAAALRALLRLGGRERGEREDSVVALDW